MTFNLEDEINRVNAALGYGGQRADIALASDEIPKSLLKQRCDVCGAEEFAEGWCYSHWRSYGKRRDRDSEPPDMSKE